MHKVAMALVKRNRSARISVIDVKERVQSLADRHLPSAPANGREISEVERECACRSQGISDLGNAGTRHCAEDAWTHS